MHYRRTQSLIRDRFNPFPLYLRRSTTRNSLKWHGYNPCALQDRDLGPGRRDKGKELGVKISGRNATTCVANFRLRSYYLIFQALRCLVSIETFTSVWFPRVHVLPIAQDYPYLNSFDHGTCVRIQNPKNPAYLKSRF